MKLFKSSFRVGFISTAAFSFLVSATHADSSSKPVKVKEFVYKGTCDASTAIALDERRFVVANDEDATLRVYDIQSSDGAPLESYNLGGFLGVNPRKPEVDIEGGAAIGKTLFWISSHARAADGKQRSSGHRLFATETGADKKLTPVGKPYTRLLLDLVGSQALARYGLLSASGKPAKTAEGLNIEGLCATPEGTLLVAFRSPLPENKAMLIPILNPLTIMTNQNETARFGEPILLNLGGQGIRDITFANGKYYLLSGPAEGGEKFDLYEWAGGAAQPTLCIKKLGKLHAEAIFFFPGGAGGRALGAVLSDDGGRNVNGRDCKDLPEAQRHFRGTLFQF